ncbi:hypothetical protein lbkm_0773 [Lachnospiraceae bacterium KM106-2]|nr:hypothetical protein lbkm_0773 [Lachnospiraceae bacterium KM106-2]
MLFTEQIIFKEKVYDVLLREKDNLLMNFVNDQKPVWNSYFGKASAVYILVDHKLQAHSFAFNENLIKKEEKLVDLTPVYDEETKQYRYDDLQIPIDYTGGIVVGRHFIDEYGYEEEYPCFSYRDVYELVFERGKLVTSIDHSRSMNRIRLNIDKGLRDIDHKKDIRCINRFMKKVLYKNYKTNSTKRNIKKKIYKVFGAN